jgi:predicted transcriptional regulator YdeE
MFKIGDFSKLAQVSVKTLRHYGKLGLLKPAWIDRFNGYRYYTADQLPRLNRILTLKDLGFSLEQIRQMLREDLPAAELRGMMRMKQAEMEQQIRAEQARLERVARRLQQIEQEGSMPAYEVVLKHILPQRVAGVRDIVPDIQRLPQLFVELDQYLHNQNVGLEPGSAPLAVYYDAEYHEERIDVEAAAPLAQRISGTRRVKIHELAGADSMACAIHIGQTERISDVYSVLLNWAENNGYRATGPNREVYLQVSKADTGPDQPVTEVQIPVQKKPNSFFISKDQEKQPMQPEIVSKPSFTAVGMLYHGKNENEEIAQMWDQFNPRSGEIQNIIDGGFGVCGHTQEDGSFDYLAGFAVSSTERIPQGMTTWEVPAQKYAVFPCTLNTLHETYRYAFETWLPTSGYKYTKGPDFEYYDENFDASDKDRSVLHIYIPIE